MALASIKPPRKSTTTCIHMKMRIGATGRPVISLSIPELAPEKARTWLKAFAEAIIMSNITLTPRVPLTAFFA